MCKPAAPARAYSTTVRRTISLSPNPVSASAMIGSPLASYASRMHRQKCSSVSNPTSGTPAATLVAAPDTYAAPNPASAIIFAHSALNAPGIITVFSGPGGLSINARSREPGDAFAMMDGTNTTPTPATDGFASPVGPGCRVNPTLPGRPLGSPPPHLLCWHP